MFRGCINRQGELCPHASKGGVAVYLKLAPSVLHVAFAASDGPVYWLKGCLKRG